MSWNNDPEVKNAKIERVLLGFGTDHGFLDHMIFFDYGGAGQGWGGYVLGYQDGRKGMDALAGDTIIAILNVVGVEDWANLSGKSCRAYAMPSKVYGIGHFLEDKWVWLNDGVHVGTLDELKLDCGF